MEEELRKRNTDCVYFLASPLTCKKGLDCEYRHSEIARLNPRDCWYWLAGNCLNPTCGFRHPPLDAHAEASSESAPLPHQSSVLANKTNIPCYFYFNGFCSKGDRCSFLHGSDGGAPFGKALKADAPPLESSKTSTVNDSGSAPAGTHHNLSETVPNPTVDVRIQLKEDVQKLAITSTPKQSVSQHMSGSECEGAALVKSDSFLPAEGIIHASSHVFSEESSEQQMDGHFEPEDRWESSPGFDVLVDDKSENFGYNDGPECLLALNRKRREHFLGYDFEDPDDYDPMDPDAELLYKHSMYNAYDTLDNELIFDDVDHSSERMLGTIMPRKRQKFLPIELEVDDRSCMDLRDHLRKRRLIDDCPTTRLSRRNESSHLIGRSHERAKRHGAGRRLHGRLASEVRRDSIEPFCGNGTLSNNARQRGRVNHSRPDQSRERYKEKRLARRHSHSSEVCRKTNSREMRFSPASTTFTGPKTLAQIKEEKRKAEEQEECLGNVGHSSRTMSVDFQGPKPLSEILKDKRRLGSVMDDDTSGS